jgi:hypothetical protein
VNPDKISPLWWNVKDIQWLMGCLTTLNHFMSRLGECGLPLYKLLKKSDSFHWVHETQKALDEFKALISKPPVLARLQGAKADQSH